MDQLLKRLYKRFKRGKEYNKPVSKNEAELKFWERTVNELVKWYNGEKALYDTLPPTKDEKVTDYLPEHNAIFTWHKLHQEPKYLADLQLNKNEFEGFKLLDIGAGPIPSATVFSGAEVYALDHLMCDYISVGYPIHGYKSTFFVHGRSEAIPFPDNFFDAVISVNAIDHVDDFYKTSQEIKRILKPYGLFRMHVHYHPKTVCEPVELNDAVFLSAYNWVEGLKKIGESKYKYGSKAKEGELYALWSNF